MNKHRIIIGDARNMSELNDQSVHLIVTSPPYWQLKDYGSEKQIGYNDTYQDYINNLNLVWNECHRVLHNGCRLCINIGDQFARSVYYGRYKIIPIRTEIIKFCETIGFDYMGAIIWQKVTTCNTTGGATIMGSFPYPRNGIIKLDYEFILLFKKLGDQPKVSKSTKENSKLSTEEWNQYFYGHWNFSGEKQNKHIAPFPEELPHRLIKMFTFVGDTVLDPFLGSGTTSVAALRLSRSSVGYEINEKYAKAAKERINKTMGLFHANDSLDINTQDSVEIDFPQGIQKLPYVFNDPVPFERKTNPKHLRFGSRIDGTEAQDKTYTVKGVLSPCKVVLDSGATIRLIGIKPNGKRIQAISFLERMTKGRKVELRFDDVKHDEHNNLQCYIYLKNKTFINAQLIKKGLVEVDTSHDYRMKSRFLSLISK